MSIGSPATGKNIISVGSYVTKNEWKDIDGNNHSESSTIDDISDFSSKGPTRDGRMAPIIAAPGQRIFAPLSSHLTEGIGYERFDVLQGGKYHGMQGTSMSSPHVTGVIALMLGVNKNLDPDAVKQIFKVSARHDDFSGSEPNNTFGYGKLNALAAMKGVITSAAENSSDDNQLIIYPNPADKFLIITIGKPASSLYNINSADTFNHLEIYNSFGKKIRYINSNRDNTLSIDLSDFPSGSYFIRHTGSSKSITVPFVISK
jgi:subtilisin family serine protease